LNQRFALASANFATIENIVSRFSDREMENPPMFIAAMEDVLVCIRSRGIDSLLLLPEV
jgi:hypothetical protein